MQGSPQLTLAQQVRQNKHGTVLLAGIRLDTPHPAPVHMSSTWPLAHANAFVLSVLCNLRARLAKQSVGAVQLAAGLARNLQTQTDVARQRCLRGAATLTALRWPVSCRLACEFNSRCLTLRC
jgi:hypothetical protein